MENHVFRTYPNHPDTALYQILLEAQHRWLRPLEICEILSNYKKFKLTAEPPHKPQSGSLFLFDRKVLRYFRKDGHNWRKKKDGKTVREAHERLKAGSVEVLHCYYAHGEENDNFQRRSYWMLDPMNEHIVLVHYREVKEGSRSGLRSPNSYTTEGSPSIGNSNIMTGVSPQTSPLVSPRASSTSADWNGLANSSERDEIESSDDIDKHRLSEFESKPSAIVNGESGIAAKELGHQHSTSFHNMGIYTHNYTQSYKMEPDTIAAALVQSRIHAADIGKENSAAAPPGNFGFSQWSEALKQSNVQGNSMSLPKYQDEHEEKNILANLSVASHEDMVQRLRSNQAPAANIYTTTVAQPQLSSEGLNRGNYDMPAPGAAMPEPYRSHLQEPITDDVKTSVSQVGFGKEPSFMNSYPGVFRDFQADAVQDNLDTLSKYDSFGRWINQAIGVDTGQPMFPLSTDTTYWASTATEAPSLVQKMHNGSGFVPSVPLEKCFSISDYCPSVGSSQFDTKVLVTGTFQGTIEDPYQQKWGCMFGDVEVPAELLQGGVFRCYAPPHTPGKVPFYVTRNDRNPCSEVRIFEYYADSKPSFAEEPEQATLNKRDMLFQIRLARMLSHKTLPLRAEESSSLHVNFNSLFLFEEWEEIEDQLMECGGGVKNLKEQLIQNLLKEKLQLWLEKVIGVGNRGAAILDDHGLGVLHMGAALGYSWIISPFLRAGVNINFRDSRGWTALHWAAHCGRESMVIELLANGAAPGAKTDPTSTFPDGQTAADLASSEGHKGIAGYLAESLLTGHLQLMNLNPRPNEIASTSARNQLETVSEGVISQSNLTESEQHLPLAAVRNATHAAALIHTEFRLQSFKKKQESYELEEDEYGISTREAHYIAAARKSNTNRSIFGDDDALSQSAAVRIQQKFRGWKGRRDFLCFRQHVVKIQAHFRGHQVRKQHSKLLWSVSIVEKAILRWRRRRKGLRGFEPSKANDAGEEEDVLKSGRRQIERGLEKALARVQSMAKSPEGIEQYRRLMHGYQKAKVHLQDDAFNISDLLEENEIPSFSNDDDVADDFAMLTYH